MTAKWYFPKITPTTIQGRGLAEDNFAQETKPNLSILIREVIQNLVDAIDPYSDEPARLRLLIQGPDEYDDKYLQSLFPDEYLNRLKASGSVSDDEDIDFESCNVLILEDFGTTGLLGATDDPNTDGPKQNWNAFWFREGEGTKGGGANGRAGQGKITFFRVGRARAIFGLTVRTGEKQRLLMGRSSFTRVYPFGSDGKKYMRDAFWCIPNNDGFAFPVQSDDTIDQFCDAFKLVRGENPGLSLVIPFSEKIDVEQAVGTVIAEFYYPIVKGRLIVEIGSVGNKQELSKDTIEDHANRYFTDEKARELESCFTKDYREFILELISDEEKNVQPVIVNNDWNKDTTTSLDKKIFPEGSIDTLKEAFFEGKRVAVRFPVTVKPKHNDEVSTFFDVHLQLPDSLDRFQEAYLRGDLLIGHEARLKSFSHLPKARGFTCIQHDELSSFLADAEEPTHLKWNASRPRLAEQYKRPGLVVASVRNAMPALLAFLSGSTSKRDVKALAQYFTKPKQEGLTSTTVGEKPGKKVFGSGEGPSSRQKLFILDSDEKTVRLRPNSSYSFQQTQFPIQCILEMAYEGLDLDPFDSYDPFDFDLSDEQQYKITKSEGIEIIKCEKNLVNFDILHPSFDLQIDGFDPNLKLRVRLDYDETKDLEVEDEENING